MQAFSVCCVGGLQTQKVTNKDSYCKQQSMVVINEQNGMSAENDYIKTLPSEWFENHIIMTIILLMHNNCNYQVSQLYNYFSQNLSCFLIKNINWDKH